MVGLPPGVLFPYIDMHARFLWSSLVWFRKLLLLQPQFSTLSPHTEQAQALGWLDVERPLRVDLDTKNARRLVAQWKELARLYEGSGYLTYIKHGTQHMEDEPGWLLTSEIRGYGQLQGPISQEDTLRGQLLLQMAQDVDIQRREIQEELADLGRSKREMLRHMGVEESFPEVPIQEPLPDLERDDFLIPQRIRAWSEMFGAMRSPRPRALLTSNSVAVEFITDRCIAECGEGAGEFPVVLMDLRIPVVLPEGPEETSRIRAFMEKLTPWRIFCEKLHELLEDLTPSPQDHWDRYMARARALSSYFHTEVEQPLVREVNSRAGLGVKIWDEATLKMLLLPMEKARAVFPLGFHEEDHGNLFLFHWEGKE